MGFPVTSPVIRFLTGLEIVLTKGQEWERNAHSGVSLSVQLEALTQQIIAWRKQELQCWKNGLSNEAARYHWYSVLINKY